MKICNTCNSMQPDNATFCSRCGCNSLRDALVDSEELNNYDFAEIKKQGNKKMFSILFVLALIIIIIVAITVVKITKDNNNSTNSNTDNFTYSVDGKLNQNIYTNEWADLKFEMSEDWQNATVKQYKSYEDEITKCDFYATDLDGSSVVVLLTDLSNEELSSYSEDKLMKEMSSGIASGMTDATIEENSYQLIGNQLYLYTNINGQLNNNDICVSSYVRKLDNKAITINILSNNFKKNQVIFNNFDSCS